MELNEFLEKFLPDYKQKKKNYLIEAKLISFAHNKDYNSEEVIRVCTEYTFNNKYFPEALQNYTDLICEKQRRYCADIVEDRINDHECEPFEDGIYVDSSEILDAEQPIIEDL